MASSSRTPRTTRAATSTSTGTTWRSPVTRSRNAQDQGIYSDEDSHHAQILGNWIHHNGQGVIHQSHGIYLQGNDHLVANNVIHDHVEGFGIQVYDRNSRSIITANTVTGAGHSGIVVGGSGGVDNIRVVNNVFAFNAHYGISHDSSCPTASRADHNVVFGNAWGQTQAGLLGPRLFGREQDDRSAVRQLRGP